jgi:hypothetical protein
MLHAIVETQKYMKLEVLPDNRKREKIPPDTPFSKWTIAVHHEAIYGNRSTEASSEHETCGVCGNKATKCIYAHASGSKEPSSIDEIYCPKCQCFTVYTVEGY